MGDPLRDRRPLEEWAANEQVIEISSKIGEFERLAQIVEADLAALRADEVPVNWREPAVSGRLEFGRGEAETAAVTLEGYLETALPARCQRCLAPFELPVRTELKFELLRAGDQAEPTTAGEVESWELPEGSVSPAEIVDEALVMALPLAAMHEASTGCVELGEDRAGGTMTTPFASLRAQMESNED
jgi:uncharacterized metal-binding protein YceD (DUF177 family)